MKKASAAFMGIVLCSALYAADFGFFWKNEWGWVDNFHDEYNLSIDALGLGIHADIDEYNSLYSELRKKDSDSLDMDAEWNKVIIATDIGGYLGFTGVNLILKNGYDELGGGDEYSDFGLVGYAGIGTEMADLQKDWGADLTITSGIFRASIASSWNLGVDSLDGAVVNADSGRQVQFFAGAVDVFPGFSIEAGLRLDPDRRGTTVVCDAAYRLPLEDSVMIFGGSMAHTNLDGTDFTDIYGLYTPVFETVFGLGAEIRRVLNDDTELYASVSYKGDEIEAVRALGGGAGISHGGIGAEAAASYHMTLSAGDPMFEGLDLSVFADVGVAEFTLGYVFTDGYGWSSNSIAPMTAIGGAYVNFTSEF